MSSYKTRAVSMTAVALLAVTLSACGYRPLYGNSSINPGLQSDLSTVKVAPIADRPGQILHTELVRRFNPTGANSATAYKLKVTLSQNIQKLAVLQNTSATRANLNLTATYTLIQNNTGNKIREGRLRAVASYNLIDSDYATRIAEDDARERALKSLAEQLHQQVAFYLHSQNQPNPDGS